MTSKTNYEGKVKDFVTFAKEAERIAPHRVFTERMLRFAYGVDASCYSYLPEVVVKANSEREVIDLVLLAKRCGTPVTFRAAGSSLSGQCSSDNVLIVANDGFKSMQVLDNGNALRAECGVIGADANEFLKPYGKKIGPDPATITTALIGGIVNNNSSGMCCGTALNSYKTIRSIRVVFTDGFVLDTSDRQSISRFMMEKADMVEKLLQLREDIMADQELVDLIRRKFKIKNTTGYSINALVDFEDVIDIINHLFVGSEGTIGFVSEVVYNCVDDAPHKACGLLMFESLEDASKAIVILAGMPREVIVAAEMMDYLSLKAVQRLDEVPDFVREVNEGACAILLQSESAHAECLEENLKTIEEALKDIKTSRAMYSKDAEEYNAWWMIRKGILPIAAGQRRSGTTVITEDLCFKIPDFCDGIAMITELFKKYNFVDSGVIFGHALSGNVHFIITPDFSNAEDMNNFTELVREMSERVAAMEGSIKAEHGTGRMIAPFVELEWGKKAYEVNLRIKEIFDKPRLLNPDVMITDDPDVYKKNLKAQSPIDPLFNMCMECGACERMCPSRNLTLTPRQRIALLREHTRALAAKEYDWANELKNGYTYYGEQTCAACSMCSTACPLGIDTAKIALSMREMERRGAPIAKAVYSNFKNVLNGARVGVTMSNTFGKAGMQMAMTKMSELAHSKIGMFPHMPPTMPKGNFYKLRNQVDPAFEKNVVYFSTCANRAFKQNQGYPDDRSLQQVVESLCKKAGYNVIYPEGIEGMCCGLSFENYEELDKDALQRLENALKVASKGGAYPIVIDHSACFSHSFKHIKGLEILDISEFLYNHLVPEFNIEKVDETVLVHAQCKVKTLGKAHFIEKLARLCADKVYPIKSFECDGFAGNKGFFTPELNQCATKDLAAEAEVRKATLGVSSSSTCEIGLGEHGKIPFVSIAYLLDRCSSPKKITR